MPDRGSIAIGIYPAGLAPADAYAPAISSHFEREERVGTDLQRHFVRSWGPGGGPRAAPCTTSKIPPPWLRSFNAQHLMVHESTAPENAF